ncbi:hypothetical protein [Metabacillus sp. RGM 3146]|uniref:hypothetical protein n=1 Tax=Metabacillus sp. RGM 3146 TaxID=3401092 RepID=UPI003B9D908C
MTKKRLWISAGLILVIILVYWFYFSKPAYVPSKEQAIKDINSSFPKVYARVIQDTIRVDERHVLIPFISKGKNYGLSYWVWQYHKWNVAGVDTKGSPSIWKINKNDPSTYQLVWNIHHPDNQLNSIDFYLMRKRNFNISGGIEQYDPKVQMNRNVSLLKKTYGVVKLPKEWSTLMNSFTKAASGKQNVFQRNDPFPDQTFTFGWLSISKSGKDKLILDSINGTSYSSSSANLEELMVLNKDQVELPY